MEWAKYYLVFLYYVLAITVLAVGVEAQK